MSAEKLALSVTEAATLLGVSRPTVYELIKREDFPSFRIGTRRVISRAGLERWVDEQARKGCDVLGGSRACVEPRVFREVEVDLDA